MLKTLLSVTILLSVFTVSAQQARVQKFSAPLAGKVVLRDVEDKYGAEVHSLEAPEPDALFEQMKLEEIKKQIEERFPQRNGLAQSKNTKTTAAPNYPLQQPVIDKGFAADLVSGIPPDNDMAISKGGKAVCVINSRISILDGETSGTLLTRKTLEAYSQPVGLNNPQGDYRYDPKIIYDFEADKFISIMLSGVDSYNHIVIGFSKTNDPSGEWNFYKFYGNFMNDHTWFDYPSISITKDEFFFTGNKILFDTSWQEGFIQSLIYQVDKQSGFNGDAMVTFQVWDNIKYNGKAIRNLYPVKGSTELLGPAQYFLSNRNFDIENDTIFLVRMPDRISSNNKNISITALKSPIKYGVPPNGRQPDTSVELATNDGRILGAYAHDNEIHFVSTTTHPVNGNAAIYHGIIANYPATPRIDYAAYYTIDTLDLGYPNIAYAGNGKTGPQSFISFNYTGPKTNPGLGITLYENHEYANPVNLKSGDSSIKILQVQGKSQRWGDYMGLQADYAHEPGSVWVLGIFGRSNRQYGNWMAKVSSPLRQIASTRDVVMYPNPSFQFMQLEFSLDKEQVVSFVIFNSAGQMVDKILERKCDVGRNRVQFNTAPLASGIYYLKAMSPEGKVIDTQRFLRQ
jgi:hypothetical protein